MKRHAIALACFAALAAAPGLAAEQNDTARAATLSDRMLSDLVKVSGVPALAGAIEDNGSPLWAGAAGFKDLENSVPATPDTIFRFASVSKLFAATGAAWLIEKGKLDPEAQISTIIPYLPDGKWAPITTRQLAAHISGIPHYQAIDAFRGASYFDTVRDAMEMVVNRDLLFTPGDQYQYSTHGYTVLTAVVEESAGTPYLDFLKSEITNDLLILPDGAPAEDERRSKNYEINRDVVSEVRPIDFSYSWGGAGMSGSATALASFGSRVVTGALISTETFDMALTPARFNNGEPVGDRSFQVGIGWRTGHDIDGKRVAHHAGFTPGARSALVVYPEEKRSISILSNAAWPAAIETTAMTLAAPFSLPAEALVSTQGCPLDKTSFSGTFNDEPVSGTAQFSIDDGLCVGTLSSDNTLGEWLKNARRSSTAEIRVVGLVAQETLSHAVMVTPVGLFELRASDNNALNAQFGSRALSITFAQ